MLLIKNGVRLRRSALAC